MSKNKNYKELMKEDEEWEKEDKRNKKKNVPSYCKGRKKEKIKK